MIRFVVTVWLGHSMFMLSAQEAGTPDLGLWMVEAIEADCLTRDELALVASEPPPIREQTIVNLFGMARGKEALRCLRGLLSWTDHVQSLDQIKPPRSTMSMRTDGVLSTGTEGGQVDWGWRWRGHQGFASGFSGRWDWSSRSGFFPWLWFGRISRKVLFSRAHWRPELDRVCRYGLRVHLTTSVAWRAATEWPRE